MAKQPEMQEWAEGVYMINNNDEIRGGRNSAANKPLLDLANRTSYLGKIIGNMEDALWRIWS
jgi:hypothetical protein